MKSILFFGISFLIVCGNISAQYVTIDGRQFKDKNGDDFYPVVCNYLVQFVYTNQNPSDLIVTPDKSCDGGCYDCNNLTTCLNQMTNNFNKIKEMGFNTIRLFGVNPDFYYKPNETGGFKIRGYDLTYFLNNNCDPSCSAHFHDYSITYPYSTNPIAQRVFTLTDSIIVRAWKSGLYVILLSGRGVGDYTINYPGLYANYLYVLASHINSVSPQYTRDALLAYDLNNEPTVSWNPNTLWPVEKSGHTKQDVCNNIRMFYDMVKSADPHHLITYGGIGIGEIFEFDASIMKINFYSPHFYPRIRDYDPSHFSNMLDRVHGQILWLKNNLPMPYLVGETGFRSIPNGQDPDGDNTQQKEYAQSSLDLTRFYDGSGYSWWVYQDYYWSVADCFFGLLYWNDTSQSVQEKFVVDAFQNYNPNLTPPTFTIPDNYRDPFNHGYYNNGNNYVSGHVQDQFGNPIIDAVVMGWTILYRDENDIFHYEDHYTFTDETGDFQIIPFDYDYRAPNWEVIAGIRVTAPGCTRFTSDWWDDDVGVRSENVNLIVLERNTLKFYDFIQNQTITSDAVFQAWDKLTFKDVTIAENVSFEAKARNEIVLLSEFQSHTGSDAWFHLSETFRNCEELGSDIFLKNNMFVDESMKSYYSENNSMTLVFEPINNSLDFDVFPNPTKGIFIVEIPKSLSLNHLKLSIFDQYGKTIMNRTVDGHHLQIDLSRFSEGLYQIRLSGMQGCISKKIVLL